MWTNQVSSFIHCKYIDPIDRCGSLLVFSFSLHHFITQIVPFTDTEQSVKWGKTWHRINTLHCPDCEKSLINESWHAKVQLIWVKILTLSGFLVAMDYWTQTLLNPDHSQIQETRTSQISPSLDKNAANHIQATMDSYCLWWFTNLFGINSTNSVQADQAEHVLKLT